MGDVTRCGKVGLLGGPVGWTLELSRGRNEIKGWPARCGQVTAGPAEPTSGLVNA